MPGEPEPLPPLTDWRYPKRRQAWLATREAWECAFIALMSSMRALAAMTEHTAPGEFPMSSATMRMHSKVCLRQTLGAPVAPDDIALTTAYFEAVDERVRIVWDVTEVLIRDAGLAAIAAHAAETASKPHRQGRAWRRAVRFGAASPWYNAQPGDRLGRDMLTAECTLHQGWVRRFVEIPEPRRLRLRIAHEVLGEDATPDALVAAAENWSDSLTVACDLIAERGWSDATVGEVRLLLLSP